MTRPEVRWTAAVLTLGTVLSATCFVVGFALTVLGGGAASEDPRRLELVWRAAIELRPWGWSMLGVLSIMATPAAGLVASALEMRRLQPRAAVLALVVLAILATAAILGIAEN